MSVCFHLTGSKLNAEKWDTLLSDWSADLPDNILDEPRFSEEKEPLCFVAGLGSIRGIVITLGPGKNEADVRLSALASRKDWEWAFELMAIALKEGGGKVERETGETYGSKNLSRNQAHKEAMQDFIFSANAFRPKAATGFALPMDGYNVPITASDLPPVNEKNFNQVEEALVAKMERYIGAYRPPIMETTDGKRVTTWALVQTLIPKVDQVMVDYADNMVVPYDKLTKILGDYAEDLGDLLWLPELDGKKDKAVLNELARTRVDKKA
jgi:hypothetical protein